MTLFVPALSLCALAWAPTAIGAPWLQQEPADFRKAEALLPDVKLEDAQVPSSARRLLDLAFQAASRFPLNPHIKNRSRAQETVIDEYLALDQPATALERLKSIENWRRGLSYADLAYFCAEREDREGAHGFARVASFIADNPLEKDEQTWRGERIRARVAQTYAALGEEERTREIEANMPAADAGALQAAKALNAKHDDFETHLKWINGVMDSRNFDEVKAAVELCLELYTRDFDHADRRELLEKTVLDLRVKLPRALCIDATIDFSERALAAGDREKALELVLGGVEIMEAANWALEDQVQLSAKLAQARFCAGEPAPALASAKKAFEAYIEGHESIQGIFRADALRPLAEAFYVMGEHDQAELVYVMATDAGAENPNARPRSDDLTANCISMVQVGFEPSKELWDRLVAIQSGLAEPW